MSATENFESVHDVNTSDVNGLKPRLAIISCAAALELMRTKDDEQ